MRIHLIKEETVKDFAGQHAHSRSSMLRWLETINTADCENIHDIQALFPSADLLGRGSDRIVFNVGGNHYRIICQYNFGKSMIHLYVNWIGTHNAYTELCKRGNQYTVDEY